MSFTLSQLEWLSSDPDAPAAVDAAQAMDLTARSVLGDVAALRKQWGAYARPVAELVEARRIASAKLPESIAESWWADKDAAQQSTPMPVADFRAKYLKGLGVARTHDLTCSVGTELIALHRAGLAATGSDLDPVRVAMARLNCPEVEVDVRNALDADPRFLQPERGAGVLLADPARRNSSGRITRMADMEPPVDELLEAHPGAEFMIKLAPGVDFAELEDWAGQVDVISLDGAAKEACALTPGLVAPEGLRALGLSAFDPSAMGVDASQKQGKPPLLRRAVVLTSRKDREEGYEADVLASWEPELTEAEVQEGAGQHGKYILEPDAAVIRAGLVRHFAAREGLWLLDPHLAYVTGDHIPDGMRAFEVLDAVPLKQLRRELREQGIGALEILVRGADINPDQLRKKLKLKGKNSATVVIARLGGRGSEAAPRSGEHGVMAYICQPRRTAQPF